jgi:hypothetical protein
MTTPLKIAALLALAGLAGPSHGAWELTGTKTIVATAGDETRTTLGSVQFLPGADGSVTFKLSLDPAPFSDHFLSMREFKCLPGRGELTCHVPYPHAQPATVARGNLAWLEHSLLFFYKRPSDFGAKLWNGIYFELQETATGLVGKPRAIDLNLIAAPPANPGLPPFGPALRDDMPANARWIRSLSIE